MENLTADPTSTGVAADPAAGDGGQPAAPPAAPTEPGAQPAAPADDLNLSDRERAFLEGLRDERSKRQQIERELELARANHVLGSFQPAPSQPGAPAPLNEPAQPADPFADLDDDDLMTGADIKAKVVPKFMGMLQQIAGAIAVQQRQAQFSDVTNDDIRTHIPKIIAEDPALAQVIKVLPAPAQFIIAQTLTRFAKNAAPRANGLPPEVPGTPPAAPSDPLSDIARAILANARKPGAPGSGGGGALDDVVALLKSMTPEQYEAYRQQKKKDMGL